MLTLIISVFFASAAIFYLAKISKNTEAGAEASFRKKEISNALRSLMDAVKENEKDNVGND